MPKGKNHLSIYGALKHSAVNMSPLQGEKNAKCVCPDKLLIAEKKYFYKILIEHVNTSLIACTSLEPNPNT